MAKARDTLMDAKPYVQRAIQDEEVREHVKSAIAAAREIYEELMGGRGATAMATKVATDSEIQDNLRSAVDDLKKAANRVQGRRERSGRNALLLMTGIVLGILFNPVTGPQTRRWLADKILGESPDVTPPSANSAGGT
jgi:hypothetical protein